MNMHCILRRPKDRFNGAVLRTWSQDFSETYRYTLPDNTMAPRGLEGDVIYIHPQKPVTPGCFVLVRMADGSAPVVRRFVQRSGNVIRLSQLSPARDFEVAAETVELHRVVGWSEPD